uniref:Peptidase S1 domain-containing protein n=1 Tax=Acrobeloides nanus TaxID=290746 RepID=A0A914C0U9_9BILA
MVKVDKIDQISLESNDEPGEAVHKVKAMYLHPNYKTPEYDIALIELETPIIYSQHVQPICLPSVDFNQIRPSNTAWAIGWGLIVGKKDLYH